MTQRIMTNEEVIKAACLNNRITVNDFFSEYKERPLSQARKEAILYFYNVKKLPVQRIAQIIKRDRKSIDYAINGRKKIISS